MTMSEALANLPEAYRDLLYMKDRVDGYVYVNPEDAPAFLALVALAGAEPEPEYERTDNEVWYTYRPGEGFLDIDYVCILDKPSGEVRVFISDVYKLLELA